MMRVSRWNLLSLPAPVSALWCRDGRCVVRLANHQTWRLYQVGGWFVARRDAEAQP